jgi:hypothetical protein
VNESFIPVPPARLDNCAKPTDAGEARYTEYTFFCKAENEMSVIWMDWWQASAETYKERSASQGSRAEKVVF